MMHAFLLLMFALAGVGFCDDSFGLRLTTEKIKPREDTNYFYRYYVQDDLTGDYKTQEEMKKGDSVRGSYTVAEPNGNLRKVTYKAGPGRGFEAMVDIQPNGSPTRETLVAPTQNFANPKENLQVVESNKQRFPEEFVMDALRQGNEGKAQTEMKFLMKRENNTEMGVAEATEAIEVEQMTSGEVVLEDVGLLDVANQTSLMEAIEDPEDKRINEAIGSMPKIIPDFVLSDNKTHFKDPFHKDPEEALLDERISQIARQLAETDLRKAYERKKLGHYLPISVTQVGLSTPTFLSKSLKFTANEVPDFRPSLAPPTAQSKEKDESQYKKPAFSNLFPSCNRLPAPKTQSAGKSTQVDPSRNPETVTSSDQHEMDQLLKMALPEMTRLDTTTPRRELGHRGHPFFRFFTPKAKYIMYTQKSYQTAKNPELIAEPLILDLTTGPMPVNEDALFAAVPVKNDYSTEKS